MHPRRTRARWALPLLSLALGTTACDNLKSEPAPPPPPGQEEPPPELRVTVRTEGPEYCREGQWTLSVSVEGGTPERVELLTNAQEPMTLEAPYQHVIDCATHAEGRFSFLARAVGEERNFEAEEPSVVVVDRTAPTIASRRPLLSHPSVADPLAFVFSEPLLPSSLQSSPTQLRDQDGFSVAHQAVLSEDGTVLELVPSSPVRPPTTLHAELLQRTLTDRAGNPLDPRLTAFALTHNATYWPFRRATEPLDPTNVSILPMSLALSGVGGTIPVVAFVNTASNTEDPVVALWDGQSWQRLPPLRAEDARSQLVEGIQVAAKDNTIVAAWRERIAETQSEQLHVVRYTGLGWQRLGTPYDTQSGYTQIKMALDWVGNPVIALERLNGLAETEVRVRRWTGTEWLALGEPLSANPAPHSYARRSAIAADREVVVSWMEESADADALHLYVSRFENGGWSPVGAPIPITTGTSAERVEIALSTYDRVFVAWSEINHTTLTSIIRFSSATLGTWKSNWSPSDPIETLSQAATHDSLRLAVDSGGEPSVAWTEYPVALEEQSYYRRRRAAAWEPKQFISGETLRTFLLDENAFPWALSGNTIVRPQ